MGEERENWLKNSLKTQKWIGNSRQEKNEMETVTRSNGTTNRSKTNEKRKWNRKRAIVKSNKKNRENIKMRRLTASRKASQQAAQSLTRRKWTTSWTLHSSGATPTSASRRCAGATSMSRGIVLRAPASALVAGGVGGFGVAAAVGVFSAASAPPFWSPLNTKIRTSVSNLKKKIVRSSDWFWIIYPRWLANTIVECRKKKNFRTCCSSAADGWRPVWKSGRWASPDWSPAASFAAAVGNKKHNTL